MVFINERWEYNYTFNTPGKRVFKVSAVSDTRYGLTVINDLVGALSIIWREFEVVFEGITFTIPIKTNSTILDFIFNPVSKQINLTLSGPKETKGTTNITIPKNLIPESYEIKIYFDGEPYNFTLTKNATHYLIVLNYTHSLHQVTIKTVYTGWTNDIIILVAILGTVFGLTSLDIRLSKPKNLSKHPSQKVKKALEQMGATFTV